EINDMAARAGQAEPAESEDDDDNDPTPLELPTWMPGEPLPINNPEPSYTAPERKPADKDCLECQGRGEWVEQYAEDDFARAPCPCTWKLTPAAPKTLTPAPTGLRIEREGDSDSYWFTLFMGSKAIFQARELARVHQERDRLAKLLQPKCPHGCGEPSCMLC